MLMEKLAALIGAAPSGSDDIVWVVSALVLLYFTDCFCSLLKIAFNGLK